ncbi:eukaryotic translation initiation factor 3 subunit G-like [Gossypium australe]|uniref:Eukaryotic translation initiation factor 3 subunit G n=1 Tax=Gossypium australe TaxID=47621 RepID=A0A5B6WYE3_9ROSI|nr:eukaryotic translation initiation factor 3 subunit G-like [Gossypium australe]
MATKATKQTKFQWADIEDNDAEDLTYLLPPKEVIGPDKNGIKKVIEYKFNEEGKQVRVTTTIRVRKIAVDSPRKERILERRSWAKFGSAMGDEDDDSRLTMVSTEEISLERRGSRVEEPKVAAGHSLAQQAKNGAVLMVCRTCGKKGDHWTARCPYKDQAPPPANGTVDKPPASETVSGKTAYVPPSKRGAGAKRNGTDMKHRDEENTIRFTNLSEDAMESDLHELVAPFGPVSRVHVGINRKTGLCRGFGFVNFVKKEDAERAVLKLNGFGYDSLILRVQWAGPSTN